MGVIRFGASGWQARVDNGFDAQNVGRIADALGQIWRSAPSGSRVLVGFDTRRDSERFAVLLGEIVASYGPEVVVSDRACPTPALGWSVARDAHCIGGVMLTASEKPREYGGVLVRHADGGPVSDAFAELLTQRMMVGATAARGTVARANLVDDYIDAQLAYCDTTAVKARRPRVVVDTMHGAGCGCVGDLFERAGCEVVALHDEAARDFRGLHPDPREPWVDACERRVVECRADLGIVLDGDCDRMALIDATGRLVSSHMLAPLVLEQLVVHHGVEGRVVATSACSARVERTAEQLDLDFTMVPVGMQPIYRELCEGDVVLAADEEGGVYLPGHLYERDGIAAALCLAEMFACQDTTLANLVEQREDQFGRSEYGRLDLRCDPVVLQRLRILLPGMNPRRVAGKVPVRVGHGDGLRLWFDDGSWLLIYGGHSHRTLHLVAEAPSRAQQKQLIDAARELVGL